MPPIPSEHQGSRFRPYPQAISKGQPASPVRQTSSQASQTQRGSPTPPNSANQPGSPIDTESVLLGGEGDLAECSATQADQLSFESESSTVEACYDHNDDVEVNDDEQGKQLAPVRNLPLDWVKVQSREARMLLETARAEITFSMERAETIIYWLQELLKAEHLIPKDCAWATFIENTIWRAGTAHENWKDERIAELIGSLEDLGFTRVARLREDSRLNLHAL